MRFVHRFVGPEMMVLGNQTLGSGLAGQTSMAATSPTIVLDVGATRAVAILRMSLVQMGTVAANNISYAIASDTANRIASGGTALTPFAIDGSGFTSTVTVKTGATASAAGTGTKYLRQGLIVKAVGTTTTFEWSDGLYIPVSGSFLFYSVSASTAPTWGLSLEWAEIAP